MKTSPTATTSSATTARPLAAAAAKKAATTSTTSAKKAAGKKAPAKAAKKAPAKAATTARKPAAKKTTAAKKTATAKKAPAKKTAAAKVPAKKATAKAAPGKKAASPFDAKFLEAQKVLLGQERGRLLHDADSLTAEANSLAELREPGDVQFDEESGEGDTLAVERERDLALSAQFRDQVDEIDRAMAKFELGTYGICEVSGTPIPKERLKAIPWARERVEYKVGGFGRR